jgi:hypothetical protein
MLVINGTLHVTPNHPVFTSRGSVRADAVRVGDQIFVTSPGTTSGGLRPVTSIVAETVTKPIYTLRPVNGQTFVVNGVVVFIKQY